MFLLAVIWVVGRWLDSTYCPQSDEWHSELPEEAQAVAQTCRLHMNFLSQPAVFTQWKSFVRTSSPFLTHSLKVPAVTLNGHLSAPSVHYIDPCLRTPLHSVRTAGMSLPVYNTCTPAAFAVTCWLFWLENQKKSSELPDLRWVDTDLFFQYVWFNEGPFIPP